MNRLKTIITISIIVALNSVAFAQSDKLHIVPQIKLPYDSLTKAGLISTINLFLEEKENDFIGSITLESNHYEKFKDFFGAFKGIENSNQYGGNFYKCHLKNIVLQPDSSYKVDLSYYGIIENSQVIDRITFSLIARNVDGRFKLYCPFETNTKNWKSKKIENITFYFKDTLNEDVAKDFEHFNRFLSEKLKLETLKFDFYNCQDIQEVYQLLGIKYDLRINGDKQSGWFNSANTIFTAGTNKDQYKHDLTHRYFWLKYGDDRNWTAEEGYNIYITDFWGESPEQIFRYLKEYIKNNPDKSLYNAFVKHNEYLKRPIPLKFPLSALLMRKLEREKGFDKILEIVETGKTDDGYFKLLEKYIGLTADNFDEIIKEELNRVQ